MKKSLKQRVNTKLSNILHFEILKSIINVNRKVKQSKMNYNSNGSVVAVD